MTRPDNLMMPPDSPTTAQAEPPPPGETRAARNVRPRVQSGSPLNFALIVASIAVTLYVSFGEDWLRFQTLAFSTGFNHEAGFLPDFLPEVRHGELWRLWTPMFIHLSVLHLGFNMIGMYDLGKPLEEEIGTPSYLLLCLVLALLTNMIQYLVSGPYFGGMSGVWYGLFGYVWLRGRCDKRFPLEVPTEMVVLGLIWFVACFTGFLGKIGNASHSAGLVIGAIWGACAGFRVTSREKATLVSPGNPPT